MFKKFLVVTALIFTTGSLAAAEIKIGVVDIQAVISKAPQIKSINEKIQAQFKDRQEALRAMDKKGQSLKEKLKRDEMTLTMAQKLEIQRELQELDSKFELKKKFLLEDINIANKQEQGKIMRKIQQAISKVAADDKFDLIINAEASVYANPAINISDKVITIISNPAG